MRALDIAATGMLAQQTNVDIISNNLANINTAGYKRHRAEFQDLLYQSLRRVGAASSSSGTVVPAGVLVGGGVRTASVYRIPEQGVLRRTDNTYDLALQGRGYFMIELPSGETGYTRAGAFQISRVGQIVTQDGYTVLPGVAIPADAVHVSIDATGQVQVKTDGEVAPAVVGQIEVALFPNESGLENIGDNLLLETVSSGAAQTGTPGAPGYGSLRQGYIETSNVNPVQEITNLITAQRAYEMNSKVITTAGEMMAEVSRLK